MMCFTFSGDNFTEGVTIVAPIGSVFDNTANDSNKFYTVPDGEMWELNWINVIMVAGAAVGNRQLEMRVLDEAGNMMFSLFAGAVQAANTTRDYHFIQGVYRESAFIANELQVPFGTNVWMPAGWTLNIRDQAAIAAAADDMTVTFQYKRFKGC
jgi:hypothetical protein